MRIQYLTLLIAIIVPLTLLGQANQNRTYAPGQTITIRTGNGTTKTIKAPVNPIQRPAKVAARTMGGEKAAPRKPKLRVSDFDTVMRKRELPQNLAGKVLPQDEMAVFYVPKKTKKATTAINAREMDTGCELISLENQADVDNFETLYPGCTYVETLDIRGNDITNLNGLSNITDVGNLSVDGTGLANLGGLHNLTYISGEFYLSSNYAMTSIGLFQLQYLGSLNISNMYNLHTIDLSELTKIDGDFLVEGSLYSFEGLEGITEVGGNLSISYTNLETLKGLEGLTKIGGDLYINDRFLQNLNALSNLEEVGMVTIDDGQAMTTLGIHPKKMGSFAAWNCGFTTLGDLTANLTETTMGMLSLASLPALTDISGLSNLTEVLFLEIYDCSELANLTGLDNLIAATQGFYLSYNSLLTDLSALGNLVSVENGTLTISDNQSLANLNGLNALTTVGALYLSWNSALTTLSGLNPNLEITGGYGFYDLYVHRNTGLSVCTAPFVCNILNQQNPSVYIANNAPGCSAENEVAQMCASAACTDKTPTTWIGDISSDWDDSQNWSGGTVPGICHVVTIPAGATNYPILNHSTDIGGLMMDGSYLTAYNSSTLTVYHTFDINNSYLDFEYALVVMNAENMKFTFSTFNARYRGLSITNFTGTGDFYGNEINAQLTIKDAPDRTGDVFIFGNKLGSDSNLSSFSFTNNSASADMYLANADDVIDEIHGEVEIVNNSSGAFYVGTGAGEPLQVYSSFRVTDKDHGPVVLNKVTLRGGDDQYLYYNFNPNIQPVSWDDLEIDSLFIRKESGSVDLYYLNRNMLVNRYLFLSQESAVVLTNDNHLLVIGQDCVVEDEDPVDGSYIRGPMKKIGNTDFSFPVGDYKVSSDRVAGITGTNEVYGLGKSPLRISAPAEADAEFTAKFIRNNPNYDGYNTGNLDDGVENIFNDGYWILSHDNGSSDVNVTLTYNQNDVSNPTSKDLLAIAVWDGSKWANVPKGDATGDDNRGTVASAAPLTTYGPLVLHTGTNIRKPVMTITSPDEVVFCKGIAYNFKVYYSLDTAAVQNTQFKVELSDADGTFPANPQSLGYNTPDVHAGLNVSDSISVAIPYYFVLQQEGNYKLRIKTDKQEIISENTISIRQITTPQVTVSIVGADDVCMDQPSLKYYPSEKEPGVDYVWTVADGTIVMDGDTAYITFTKAGNKSLKVTPTNTCGAGTATTISVNVKSGAPTAAPVLTNTGRWVNASAPAAAQKVTSYKWYNNGTLIAGVTGLSHYAKEAGDYTMVYANDCGEGPVSNTIGFANDAIAQTITFGSIPDKAFGDEPFELNAIASSGLPVQYQIVSGQGNVTAGVFTITQIGTVTIRAWQPGDNEYDTTTYVTQTFTINKGNQTITFEPMEEVIFTGSTEYITLTGSTSSGLPITYSTTSTNATISGKNLTVKGVGTITITAAQAGNANYNAATPVEQIFCVRADKLGSLTGPASICPGIETIYKTKKIAGLTYNWRLSDGTTFASDADTVAITWPAQGTYKLYVSATGSCGPATVTDSLTVNVLDGVTAPDAVQNMLPVSGVTDQKLPLFLSWVPGNNTMAYDLYVWETGTSRPATPMVANRTIINYSLTTQSGLKYDVDYNWQLVSKNGCLQTAGSIQTFRLRKAPDLVVTQVDVPAAVNSGQTITINWTVKNEGTGNTITSESWNDAVFLSFDTIPEFRIAMTNNTAFNVLAFPVGPLLIGTKPNVSALNAGQEYQNSMDFTLPLSYSDNLYVYVITNYKGGSNAPLDANHANDTARSVNPIGVTMSPTPDLRVDTVQAPATVFSGSTANISYKVTNYGALASGNWNDKIYVSKSPLFDKNNAILLKYPKANGTYYPYTGVANNGDAIVKINENIETDDFYTKNVEVIIPNFISGTWFVHVVANEDKVLYEGALAENNVNNRPIQIMPTPTPQFSLGAINTSATVATPAQVVGINWSVINKGFYDNWERNKTFYTELLGSCGYSVPVSGTPGGSTTQLPPPSYLVKPHVTYGASYWTDKIYLSTNPSGLNISQATYLGVAEHGIEGAGNSVEPPAIFVFSDTTFCTEMVINYGSDQHILKPGSLHPGSFNWKVPANLPQGDYYLYVVANPDQHVFTYIDTPVVQRSGMISVRYPDLAVASVDVPASIRGGTPFNIDYTITNTGAVSVSGLGRTDQIYISDNPVFDGTATEVKSFSFTESIPAAGSVTHTVSVTLPNGTAGTKYFFVKANSGNTFPEANMNNNTSAGVVTAVSTALPIDLMADVFSIGGNIKAPGILSAQYTVRNVGENNMSDTMVDKIFISCNPVFSEANAIEIGSWSGYRSVAAGDAANVTVNVTIPKQAYLLNSCFVKADIFNAYFFVKINATETVYEPGSMANNVAGTGEKAVQNQNADITVAKVTGDESAKVGRTFNIQWDIINNGNGVTTRLPSGRRTDAIYLSKDSVVNEDAIFLTKMVYDEDVKLDVTLTKSLNMNIPAIEEGDYYVYVLTDLYGAYLNEIDTDNNFNFIRDASGKARLIHVESTLLPDLTGEIISAPQRVAAGQPFTVKYKVTNVGAGSTYPEKWWDNVLLSINSGSSGGITGAPVSHNGVLNANETYTDSVTMTLPLSFTPGNYLLLAYPDKNRQVTESDENNNISGISIEVYLPEQVDLTVENVTAPDTVYLGYPSDAIQWVVKNQSASAARGVSTDGVYLSENITYDSTALLIGTKKKNMNLAPAAQETLSLTSVIDNVPEGLYNIIVRTDIKNNIYETDKDNNENVTSKPVYVSVKQLVLDVQLADTMTTPKYYKLLVPDSLMGSTILITLKSKDSLTQQNEVYVGGGYVPSVLKSDYKFNTPNYGNQGVLLADVTDSVYYISVRSVSVTQVQQDITLHASVLPFAVLNAQSDRGGNGGNVTVKLSGSLFSDGMAAALTNGATTIEATKVYFVNSTQVYATFPLLGKPIGVYNVKLTKPDGSEAVLTAGFSVVSPDNGGLYSGGGVNTGQTGTGTDPGCDPGMPAGLNSQLSVELVVPQRVFVGLPFAVVINYSNPTNMDIPVQTMVLYNDYGIPMSFTRDGIRDGATSLYLELTGKDGPPGVFRAGSSGSITIYTTTAPNTLPHEFIHFNLK